MRSLKIKLDPAYRLWYWIVFAILFENKLIGIVPISGSIIKYGEIFSVFCAITLVYRKTESMCYDNVPPYLKTYVFVLLLFFIFQYVYVINKYGIDSTFGFFQAAQQYFWIFLVIPVYCFIFIDGGIERICDVITTITVVTLLTLFIAALAYNRISINLLNVFDLWTMRPMRNARIRIWDLSSLEGFSALWLFYKILYRADRRILNVIKLCIIMTALFYVEQTRMMQISIIISMSVLFITKKNISSASGVIRILVIFVTIILVVLLRPIESLIDSFSTSGAYSSSSIIRLNEIEYCMKLIKENPISGTGLVTELYRDQQIAYSGMGHLGYTDIGILGLYAQIGIWSVVIYLVPLFRFANTLYISREMRNNDMYYLMLSNLVYLVLTSLTLLVLNRPRAFAWPFYIALFEYWRERSCTIE